jgi:YidC/Oxa1 family membrane protein insertase
VQLPVFFGLYFVLRTAQQAHAGIGLLNAALANSFSNATAFGAPLKYALTSPHHSSNLLVVGVALLAIVAIAQYLTQLASLKLNTVKMEGNQRIGVFLQNGLLYFAPVIFVVTSLVIPLGLLFYFAISSIWGLIQQLFIIRLLPMADTPAYAAMEARKAKKASTE